MKKFIMIAMLAMVSVTTVACQRDAQVASHNISKRADMFEIDRRVVFYNGITEQYILSIRGRCSITDQRTQLEVTCKTGPKAFVKHFLGLSDNVTYFAEQMKDVDVSVYHYEVVFKPQTIIPDVDFRGDLDDLTTNRN